MAGAGVHQEEGFSQQACFGARIPERHWGSLSIAFSFLLTPQPSNFTHAKEAFQIWIVGRVQKTKRAGLGPLKAPISIDKELDLQSTFTGHILCAYCV